MGRQKRSENTYQKINTIFFRDENNIIMPYDNLVLPELEWLRNCKWDTSVKVDGTNIRIEIYPQLIEWKYSGSVSLSCGISIKGKTDNANIPPLLDDFMWSTYVSSDGLKLDGKCDMVGKIFKALRLPDHYISTMDSSTMVNNQENVDWMLERGYIKKIGSHFVGDTEVEDYNINEENNLPKMITIYGEGYGKGIQKAGPHYIKDGVGFIGFDVKVTNKDGSSVYLNKEQRDIIFDEIGIPKVVDMDPMTIDEAIEFVKHGFQDPISEDKNFLAEGLVLKTPDGLLRKNGERLVVKVKTGDFQKYFNKYGTYDKVEQKRNPKIV